MSTEKKVASSVTYLLHALMVAAFGGFLMQQDWSSALYTALIFLLMISPKLLRKKWDVYIPFELEVASVIFIFLTLFLGSLNGFYEMFHWWDGVLHFGSGFLLGLFGFVAVYVLNGEGKRSMSLSPGFVSIFSVTFAVSIGVIWEVYEFIYDGVAGGNMMESGLPDTMGDLIVNFIGSIIVAVIAYVWMRKRKRIPLTPKHLN